MRITTPTEGPTTVSPAPRRVTQRQIAELAGVSQATVSLVLNGSTSARIPEATRARVLEVIERTRYEADPAARRLAGVDNKILGVFTYEPAFPTESLDFYTPLLSGIESAAETLGCDLLMFTSAPVEGGTRRLFHERNRLRLADGVLLLGRHMETGDLARLVDSGYRAVAVGRREAPGIPYVGIDYAGATRDLVRRALELGHRRIMLLHDDLPGESGADRLRGFADAVAGSGAETSVRPTSGADLAADWAAVEAFAPSVLVVESPTIAAQLRERAIAAGVAVPERMSMIALASPSRPGERDVDFARLAPPRTELGTLAVRLLARILSGDDTPADDELRTLIDCPVVLGSTLIAAGDAP